MAWSCICIRRLTKGLLATPSPYLREARPRDRSGANASTSPCVSFPDKQTMTAPEVTAKTMDPQRPTEESASPALAAAAQGTGKAPILALPNEMLIHIVRLVSTGIWRPIDDLRSLSLVHSRFLPFTRPHVLSSVRINGTDRLHQIVGECESAAPGLSPDQHIRFISVADCGPRYHGATHFITESQLAGLVDRLPDLEGLDIRWWKPMADPAFAAALGKLERLTFLSVPFQRMTDTLRTLRHGFRLRTLRVHGSHASYGLLEGAQSESEPVDVRIDAFVGSDVSRVVWETFAVPTFVGMRSVSLSAGDISPKLLEGLADTLEALGVVDGRLLHSCYAVAMPRLVLLGILSPPLRGTERDEPLMDTSAPLVRNIRRLIGLEGLPPNLGPVAFPELDAIYIHGSPSDQGDPWQVAFVAACPGGAVFGMRDLPRLHGRCHTDLLTILDQMTIG